MPESSVEEKIPEVEIHLSDEILEEIKSRETRELARFEVSGSGKVHLKPLVLVISALSLLFGLGIGFSLHRYVESSLPITLEMKFRDWVGKEPILDSRIITIVLDDRVFSRMK